MKQPPTEPDYCASDCQRSQDGLLRSSLTMIDDCKARKDDAIHPQARIVILVDDNPHHLTRPKRRQAFELYRVFPVVEDYIKAVVVLTEAGLLDRYPTRPADVAMEDVYWDVRYKRIRLEIPTA